MILNSIDVGGGGIVVEIPARVLDIQLRETGRHHTVRVEVGDHRDEFSFDIDPEHAEAAYRAIVKGARVDLRLAVVPR